MNKLTISAAIFALAGCAGPVTQETTKDMPTGYICRLLDSSEYITTPTEQRTLYAELETRKVTCPTGPARTTLMVFR